jgi:hypothetical protein
MKDSDRLPDIKMTRTGLYILIASVAAFILSVVIPPISLIACFSQLLYVGGALGSVIGLVFLARGAKGFSVGHQWMVKVSLVLIIITFIVYFLMMAISSIITIAGSAGLDLTGTTEGSEVKDVFRATLPFIWIGMIPVFMLLGSYLIALWGISSDVGKITLAIFIAAALGSMIGGSILTQMGQEEIIDDISDTREYEYEEFQEFGEDLAMKGYVAGMMRLTYFGLLMISLVLCLLNVNSRFKEAYISG